MSKTASISFRGRNLWAFDVSLSVLFAELINVIGDRSPGQRREWLADLLPDLRVHAVVGADFHLDLDLGLTDRQRSHLLTLMAEASQRLRERRTISAAQAAAWEVRDGRPVIWRSAPAVDTSPIADLGDAIIELARGTLPDPPRGTWWLFGLPGGPSTIAMTDEHTD